MNRLFCIFISCLLAFCLSSCCSSKKTGHNTPAKEALPDRNTRDPKLDGNPPKVAMKDSI
jgi:hypothetical protein